MEANNMAAMRKVIKKILRTFYVGGDGYHYSRLNESIYRMIEDTLSAPPRNCDRFNSVKDAAIAFARERQDAPQPCPDFTFSAWLLAPAAEQKGDNNGK